MSVKPNEDIRVNTHTYLKVPGSWLEACGQGREDRIFPVTNVERGIIGNRPLTFATVNRDGSPWVVHVEQRDAQLVELRVTPEALALEFARVLREWLTRMQMTTIIRRNRTADYKGHTCASHDFCDANMAMAQAFEQLLGAASGTLDITGETPEGELQLLTWNAAWNIAKNSEFRTI